ncbi:hypothetical protein BH09SUM1_BH09SUM1_06290 [soil metagenome]
MRRLTKKLGPISLIAIAVCLWPGLGAAERKGGSTLIELKPLFVDLDGTYSAGFGTPHGASMTTQIYFDGALYRTFDGRLASMSTESGRPAGTIYVYRYAADEMGGSALGYNHVGNGTFFHPTIPVHSSEVGEISWQLVMPAPHGGLVIASEFCFIDRIDIPSLALSKGMTEGLLPSYSVHMGAQYLAGNVFFPESDYYSFPQGAVSFAAVGFWKESAPSAVYNHQFRTAQAEGPLKISLSADGYTTSSLVLSAQSDTEYDLVTLLAPTTGKSASQFLQEDGSEPLEPPVWVKKMALEEKLTRKTQWFYPPLNRYADVNGDGVYDAGDLVAGIAGK